MASNRVPDRPRLNPALRRLRRAADTVQLGLTSQHAVTLAGLDDARLRALDLVDGTRDLDALRTDALAVGLDEPGLHDLLSALGTAGALDDATSATPAGGPLPAALEPDRLSLSLANRSADTAAEILSGRRNASVNVYGAGRLGASVAVMLAAAGVGTVASVDRRPMRAADIAAAGPAGPLGIPAGDAVAQHLRATAPVRTATAEPDPTAAVDVLAPSEPLAPPEVVAAVAGRPHLLVCVRETSAFVGPFVLPGRTPCLRCLELGRADRDAGWPTLAAQLAGRSPAIAPCDVVLATHAAAVATAEVLGYLATGMPPRTAGAVIELTPGVSDPRRRPVGLHPACCGREVG